jgi:hypothetical protein
MLALAARGSTTVFGEIVAPFQFGGFLFEIHGAIIAGPLISQESAD